MIPFNFILERSTLDPENIHGHSQKFEILIKSIKSKSETINKILPQLKIRLLWEAFKGANQFFINIDIEVLKGEGNNSTISCDSFAINQIIKSFTNLKDFLTISQLESEKFQLNSVKIWINLI